MLLNLLPYNCSQYSLMVFYISVVSVENFSFFMSYFVYLGSLSFLLSEPGQSIFNFVYPFRESVLGFIVFVFCLYFIYFLSDLCFVLF